MLSTWNCRPQRRPLSEGTSASIRMIFLSHCPERICPMRRAIPFATRGRVCVLASSRERRRNAASALATLSIRLCICSASKVEEWDSTHRRFAPHKLQVLEKTRNPGSLELQPVIRLSFTFCMPVGTSLHETGATHPMPASSICAMLTRSDAPLSKTSVTFSRRMPACSR